LDNITQIIAGHLPGKLTLTGTQQALLTVKPFIFLGNRTPGRNIRLRLYFGSGQNLRDLPKYTPRHEELNLVGLVFRSFEREVGRGFVGVEFDDSRDFGQIAEFKYKGI
jgi:hypothetical protein